MSRSILRYCDRQFIVTDTHPGIVPMTDKEEFPFEKKLFQFSDVNFELVKRWKINGSFDMDLSSQDMLKGYEKFEEPVTTFTNHVKLYPDATICIDGRIAVKYMLGEYTPVLNLKLSKVEDDSPDLKDVKISFLFGSYKEDSQEMLSCWGTPIVQDHERRWNDHGVYWDMMFDDEIFPEYLGSHYQMQLVIKIPRKTCSTI